MGQSQRQPGDVILDRYMPDASPEAREAARENLRALVRVLLRVDDRLARKAVDNAGRAEEGESIESEDR